MLSSVCVLRQVFKQIAHQPANLFRSQHERLFKVSFVDERGIDAGGLFRDTMSLYAV